MTAAPDVAAPVYGMDPLTELSHALIRRGTGDDLDPFMIPVVPAMPQGKMIVRGCFYYAVMMTPKHTVLFDNWGEGGMCKLHQNEMRAVWNTPEVLERLGMSLEELEGGKVPFPKTFEAPIPDEIIDDLDPSEKMAEPLDGVPTFAGYGKRVSLRKLLCTDMGLFGVWLESAPVEVLEQAVKNRQLNASRTGPR